MQTFTLGDDLIFLFLQKLKERKIINGWEKYFRELRREQNTGRAILVFYVGQEGDKVILPGPEVVKLLKEKLKQDSSLLELSVANIQTAVCQSNCSGHGTCDQSTRLCLCEAFWMQNLVRKHFGDGDSNCGNSLGYHYSSLIRKQFFKTQVLFFFRLEHTLCHHNTLHRDSCCGRM